MSAHGMSEAGGLREAYFVSAGVESALTEAARTGRDINIAGALYRKVNHGLAAHPATEAHPTAGEREWADAIADYRHQAGADARIEALTAPATLDADDARYPGYEQHRDNMLRDFGPGDASTSAGEGLSEAEREVIWRALAETTCGPLHAEAGWTPGEACSNCEDYADNVLPSLSRHVERIVAAREAAAATKARAEAGEQIAQAIEGDPGIRLGYNVSVVCSCLRCEVAHAAARIAREVTS